MNVSPTVTFAQAAGAESRVDQRPRCPLCAGDRATASWLGSTVYKGHTYTYLQCEGCQSLYCDPMPQTEVLALMYGAEYQSVLADYGDGGEREISRVLQTLTIGGRREPGLFVDYGCGGGRLLQEVARLGWHTVGVEFDDEVARSISREIGMTVVGSDEANSSLRGQADILHLGDVIEHLTEIDRQMPAILDLIAPGGILVAQGPLESHTNLFTLVLRLARSITPSRTSTMPPYHVLLATAEGQRRLFTRLGLVLLDFEISEVAWPAPRRLGVRDIGNLRAVGLFILRFISQFVSQRVRRDWGNRYFCTAICATQDLSPS